MDNFLQKKARLILVILIIAALSICSAVFIYNRYYKVSFINASYAETSDKLSNPYRGWYNIHGYELGDDINYTEDSVLSLLKEDKDTKLSLIEIDLENYRNKEISETGLKQLKIIFDTLSNTDKSLIIRFLYDWNGTALKTEPDNIDIITKHMEQVSSIINQHKKSIYCLQGIFIGNCGEMNNSIYMTDESMTKLMKKLDSVIDKDIFLSVRTPAQYRIITNSLDPISNQEAFDGSLKSRIGLFNDGLLGSESDLGTYGDIAKSNQKKPSDKMTRKDEISFQNTMCLFAPNGGEAVIDNNLNDVTNAVNTFKQMHITYLNNQHDLSVINKWKTQTYKGSDIFKGATAYEFIENHLGYRYYISSADFKFDTWRDETASLRIAINNTGFADCYKKFNVRLYIENDNTKQMINIPVNTDSRKWFSNSTSYITIPLNIRKYGAGSFNVYLKVIDDNLQKEIQLANKDNSEKGYKIGSFTISK